MGLHDKGIDWVRKQVYLPWTVFTGMTSAAFNETGSAAHTAGQDWASSDTGLAITQEIGTTGLVGVLMDTDGDLVSTLWPFPWDYDVKQPMGISVHWASAAAAVAARDIDWIVTYSQIAKDAALVTPATALDTVIAQQAPVGVARAHQLTSRGIINGGKFAPSTLGLGSGKFPLLSLRVELDTFDVTFSEDKFFLGLLIDYAPKRTEGAPSNRTRKFV
jgi:hypothetical protein